MIPLKHLSKSNFGRLSSISTFTTYCNQNTDEPTDMWLVPKKHISAMLSKVVSAYMKGEEFIVKIQNATGQSDTEMKIYEMIDKIKHPNFAELVCHFACFDEIMLYNRQSTLPKGFCQGGNNLVQITIMPYYRLGNIEDTRFNMRTVSSIIGQVVMASIEMFQLIGLIHSDLGPGNVVIEKTDYSTINYYYNDDQYTVGTHGLRAIILDFGVSSIDNTSESILVKELTVFINKLFLVQKIDASIASLSDGSRIQTISDLLALCEELGWVE